MNETENKISWFDRNPKKTIAIVFISAWIVLDTMAAMLLPCREIGNRSPYYQHKNRSNRISMFGDLF